MRQASRPKEDRCAAALRPAWLSEALRGLTRTLWSHTAGIQIPVSPPRDLGKSPSLAVPQFPQL